MENKILIQKREGYCSCTACGKKNYGEEKETEDIFEISVGPISFLLCPSCLFSFSSSSSSFLREWLREKKREENKEIRKIWIEEGERGKENGR